MLNHWLGELRRRITTANRRARPLRRVRFRPALGALEARVTPATLTFQDGTGGYAGTHDAEIREASATTNFGTVTPMNVDLADAGGQSFVMLRFANLFGTAANQIPTGSTINTATLTINVDNQSDATAVLSFHRMLVTWDEATVTWNTFGGNGVQTDGTEAVATPDGTIPAGQANTTGVKTINVAASLQAWVGGAGNFGWFINTTSTDGLRFHASEADPATNRPSLTVDYTPPGGTPPTVLTFQQGVGGYTASQDSQIRETMPDQVLTDNPGTIGQIRVDGEDGGGVVYGLLRFNNIFGTGPGQIPLGSTITAANLTFDLAEDGINAIFHFHRMLMDWSDTNATWNFFGGNGVTLDGTEAVATPDVTIGNSTTTIPVGTLNVNVLPSLQAWSGGAVNRGWYFRPDSTNPATDGILFRSAEGLTANLRPSLSVSFTPPAAVAAPRVASTQINGGATQRSRVTTLAVTFNTVVTFASNAGAAFTLTRVGGGAVNFTATAATVGTGTVVTLTAFTGAETASGSLNDGRYTLTALASQITAGGRQLDGNGDGTAGDNFTLAPTALFRLYGDATGDARVDNADFFMFRTTFGLGTGNPAYLAYLDFDGNGLVDNVDFFQFRTRFGTSI